MLKSQRLPIRTRQAILRISPSRSNELICRSILWIGVGGATAFFLLLALAYVRPVTIEKWARAAVAVEVQNRVTERLHVIDNSKLVRSAEGILARNNSAIAEAKAALAAQLPSRIPLIMDAMLHPDCPCRKRATETENEIQTSRIESLQKANAQVTRLIESKYWEVAQSLLNEIKIFSAANGSVFLILAATAFWWKRPALQLLAPAVVMLGAATLTFTVYLLNQDWLQTILFGDYVGLYYIPYLLVAVGFLGDVVLNRGRVTILLLGGVLSALGGILSVASC